MCSPPNKEGKLHPAILYAAKICKVDKVFRVGGVQAIGAMAYGTATIPKVCASLQGSFITKLVHKRPTTSFQIAVSECKPQTLSWPSSALESPRLSTPFISPCGLQVAISNTRLCTFCMRVVARCSRVQKSLYLVTQIFHVMRGSFLIPHGSFHSWPVSYRVIVFCKILARAFPRVGSNNMT